LLVAGLGLGAASVAVYGATGFSGLMLVLWLASLLCLVLFFDSQTSRLPRVAAADLQTAAGVALVISPVYLVGLYDWPVQVNSDEVAIMSVAKYYANDWSDPFGLSWYAGTPTVLWEIWGHLGELFGGIDLGTMRVVHGVTGLLAVAASYFLFRQLLPRRWAAFAALVMGLNHSLFMMSRMATRENTVVLVEVVALALLVRGLKHGAPIYAFLGGIAAGLGFYVYFPARAIFPIWLLFLLALAVWCRSMYPLRMLARMGAIAASGFVLMAGPVIVAGLKATPEQNEQQRLALLVFPEARKLQKEWVFASSEAEGIKTNVVYGLSAFNNTVQDHAWLYPNEGHGFLDPLTGVLLWLGVLVCVWRLARTRDDPWSLLPLTGFLVFWLGLSFLVNKAPNYSRLLIALPFVAYLATVAVRSVVGSVTRVYRWERFARPRVAGSAVAVVMVMAVTAWNITIASDFVERGRAAGDDIGSTGRYIEKHRERPSVTFAMAASDRFPYYVWGSPGIWLERMRMFAHRGQIQEIVAPRAAGQYEGRPPFGLFMSQELWSRVGRDLERRYPHGRVHNVMPDGSRVVFEVLRRR
jgi:4-amino-4-deoxy-L-arabinose transferase-like glycosyltransferase